MAGLRVSLDLVKNKMNQRNKIVDNVFNSIQQAVTLRLADTQQPADEINYYHADKNAFVFDKELIARYFTEPAFQKASHLIVIMGAHTSTEGGFNKNDPTVILAPVRRESDTDYRIVGNEQDDASSEWPTGFVQHEVKADPPPPLPMQDQMNFNEVKSEPEYQSALPADSEKVQKNDMLFVFRQSLDTPSKAASESLPENTPSGNTDIVEETGSAPVIPLSPMSAGISINEALPYLQSISRIKNSCREIIIKALTDNLPADQQAEAIRYYTGFGEGYVFDKKSIDAVSSQMTSDKHCLTLFEGTRPDPQSVPEHRGKPTLIGFVYEQKNDGTLIRAEQDPNNRSGIEYPPVLKIEDIEKGIPVSVAPDQIFRFQFI